MDELSLCSAQIRHFDEKAGFGFAEVIESFPPIASPHRMVYFHATNHRLAVGADWQNVCFSSLARSLRNLQFEPPLDLTPGAQIVAVVCPDHRDLKAIEWGQLADLRALRAVFARGWGPQDAPADVKIIGLRASSTRKRSTPPLLKGELDSLSVTDEGDFRLSLTNSRQATYLSQRLGFTITPDHRAVLTCPAVDIRPVPRTANATTWRILVKPPGASPLAPDVACIAIKPLDESTTSITDQER